MASTAKPHRSSYQRQFLAFRTTSTSTSSSPSKHLSRTPSSDSSTNSSQITMAAGLPHPHSRLLFSKNQQSTSFSRRFLASPSLAAIKAQAEREQLVQRTRSDFEWSPEEIVERVGRAEAVRGSWRKQFGEWR